VFFCMVNKEGGKYEECELDATRHDTTRHEACCTLYDFVRGVSKSVLTGIIHFSDTHFVHGPEHISLVRRKAY